MDKEELLGVIVSSVDRELEIIKYILFPYYQREGDEVELEKLSDRSKLILMAKYEIEQLLGNWTVSTPDLVQFSDEGQKNEVV